MIKTLTITDHNIIEDGPIIEVEINILDGIFQAPDGSKKKLTTLKHTPKPIRVRALIDTGSANCCISDRVADELELVEVGRKDATSALGTPHVSKMYIAQVVIPTSPAPFICNGEVQSLPMIDAKFDCIIGRSILSHCTFSYYGGDTKFVLSFDSQ